MIEPISGDKRSIAAFQESYFVTSPIPLAGNDQSIRIVNSNDPRMIMSYENPKYDRLKSIPLSADKQIESD